MTVALLDCNSFYASCEKVFRPDLADKPVLVLSNNDGCVVAMSREARNLGIPRGIPLFKARNVVERNGITVFSSNYALYADLSRRVMEFIAARVPVMEVYSIDEAFLVLDHMDAPPGEICRTLRNDIRRGIGIPTSVGIASTKVLAKISGRLAKRNPQGIFVLGDPSGGKPEEGIPGETDIDAVLKDTPVDEVWGIASALADRLKNRGIRTALELQLMNDADARKCLSLHGLRIVWELRGIPSIVFEEVTPAKKGIMSSRSFGRPVTSLDDLLEAAGNYAAAAARKLRAQESVCRLVDVWLTTNRFNPEDPQYSAGTVVSLEEPTDYLPDLVSAARRGLARIFRDGYRYRKVAVFLSGIQERSGRQADLFRTADPRKAALAEAVDRITSRYGNGSVVCAASSPTGEWGMRREWLSPGYSTRWDQVPSAKIR